MSKLHVVLPDPHSHPDYPNTRFGCLGNLVADLRPDVVINLGDWYDMPSLSSYDKGTRTHEGRRLQRDLAYGVDALERFMTPIRKKKKKLPRFIALQGNHEYRLNRAIEFNPTLLEGTRTDFAFPDHGFEWFPYNGATPSVVDIDGVSYAHYLTKGGTDRALSSVHHAHALLTESMASIVVGHTHILDYARKTRLDGSVVQGICAGWLGDFAPAFAGNGVKNWWPGLVILRNVEHGNFDPEFVSLKTVMDVYKVGD